MIAELITTLTSRRRAAKKQQIGSYLELVRLIARNEPPPVDEIIDVIEFAGKTEQELQRDVETMTQRITHAESIKRRGVLTKRRDKLQAEHEANNATWSAQIQEIQRLAAASEAAIVGIGYEINATLSAEGELSRSCLDTELLEREAELLSELSRIGELRRRAVENLHGTHFDHHAARLAGAELEQERSPSPMQQRKVDELRAIVEKVRPEHDRWDAMVRDYDQQTKRINGELAVVHSAKLVP
jgi:hypothetical protein